MKNQIQKMDCTTFGATGQDAGGRRQEMQIPRLRSLQLALLGMTSVDSSRGYETRRAASLCAGLSVALLTVLLFASLSIWHRRRGQQPYHVLVPASIAREPVPVAGPWLSAPCPPSAAGGDTPVLF